MLGVDEKKIDGIPAQRARNRENVSSPKARRELSATVIVLKTEYKKPLRRFIASRPETPSCVIVCVGGRYAELDDTGCAV